MSLEIDAIDESGLGWYSFVDYTQPPESHLHKAIFSSSHTVLKFSKQAAIHLNHSPLDQKTQTTFLKSTGKEKILLTGSSRTSGSGEIRGTVSWGEKDGPNFDISATAKAQDEEGNYGKIEIKQSSDGRGNASAAVGHKSEESAE